MARIRTVKPEFWDDEKIANISRDARLLFIGMWNFSDDYGVIKGHPTWIKNKVFPYDEIKQTVFNEWILELEKPQMIIPFSANGEKYYYIRTFTEHQKIDRPSLTRNPEAPADILTRTHSTLDEDSTNNQRGLVAVREGSHKGSVREGSSNGLFDRFWNVYPKKKAKEQARKAFLKINPSLIDVIITSVERNKSTDDWLKDRGKFIPYPATWLNGRRWEDEATELHPLAGKVSDLTIKNIQTLHNWSPKND